VPQGARSVSTVGLLPELDGLSFETEEYALSLACVSAWLIHCMRVSGIPHSSPDQTLVEYLCASQVFLIAHPIKLSHSCDRPIKVCPPTSAHECRSDGRVASDAELAGVWSR
jgi:hypothetical protein